MGKKPKLWDNCITHGDVIQYILEHGCCYQRTNGSHQIFRAPSGKSFPVQGNHLNWRMVPGMKSKLKRELLDAGIVIE